MSLVDDDRIVFGKNRNALEHVNREQRMIGDDDIGLHRDLTPLHSEALFTEPTLRLPHTLPPTHRDAAPHSRIDRAGVFIAITGLGGLGPGLHGASLPSEFGSRRSEQRTVLVVFDCLAAVEAFEAYVVIATLEHRIARFALQERSQRCGDSR